MAKKIHESLRCEDFIEDYSIDNLRELQDHIYRLLLEIGINRVVLRAYGIDHRMFHYFFKIAPMYTQKKVKFMEKLLDAIKDFAPGLYELHKKMELYICILKNLENVQVQFKENK